MNRKFVSCCDRSSSPTRQGISENKCEFHDEIYRAMLVAQYVLKNQQFIIMRFCIKCVKETQKLAIMLFRQSTPADCRGPT